MPVLRAALFLDRDGTLIVHKPHLHLPAQVELLPGAIAGLGALRSAGFDLFLVTNQSGIGRGWFTLSDVEAVHARMLELLGHGIGLFKGVCIAPEAPGQPSRYRKPSPRFIQEQIAEHHYQSTACWMIGDNPSDWKAGLAAGINSIAVRSDLTTPETEVERLMLGVPLFSGLADATDHILRSLPPH
jgi:D-glycero-D-manno-heptose 1,7-bisphosphate phosphatase